MYEQIRCCYLALFGDDWNPSTSRVVINLLQPTHKKRERKGETIKFGASLPKNVRTSMNMKCQNGLHMVSLMLCSHTWYTPLNQRKQKTERTDIFWYYYCVYSKNLPNKIILRQFHFKLSSFFFDFLQIFHTKVDSFIFRIDAILIKNIIQSFYKLNAKSCMASNGLVDYNITYELMNRWELTWLRIIEYLRCKCAT